MKLYSKIAAIALCVVAAVACNQKEIDNLQAQTDSLSLEKASVEALEQVNADLRSLIDSLEQTDGSLQSQIDSLEQTDGSLQSQIDLLKEESANLSSILGQLRNDSGQLAGTKDWANATFATLEQYNALVSELASVKSSVSSLTSRLSSAEASVSSLSSTLSSVEASLEKSISDLESTLKAWVNAQLANYYTKNQTDSKLTELKNSLIALQSSLDALTSRVGNLEGMVQSITVVPTYSDGSVQMTEGADNVLYFDVLPSGVASKLAAAGKNAFKFKTVSTQTKAYPEEGSLEVVSVASSGDVLAVTVSATSLPMSFYWQSKTLSGSLQVSSGVSSFATSYFPLAFPVIEAVDLGLSVKWASCNLGAIYPEDSGNYYAWGETEPKDTYSQSNYKFFSLVGTTYQLNKYCTSTEYGPVDNKTALENEDDAAYVTSDGLWRMPTKEEFDELMALDWALVQQPVLGFRVKGNNGNSIFLPATKYKPETSSSNPPTYYWSSTTAGDKSAYCLQVVRSARVYHYSQQQNRYYGLSIRPVQD